ncbi:putative Ras-related protein Rab-33 [Centruroides vittatus]|uniref:putative Ras-related protein Rab-33 n=1 Tax=Centruroides sculpturatus TaxID=218467 RepID=UPI000C6E1C9E|nr:putative Ras-related protein Rab-33 [Centruroides sculpturatus]
MSESRPEKSVKIDKQKRIFKIIVIGDSNVGKTCLTFRFCGGKFPNKTEATIGVDFRERLLEVDGEQIRLQLWDTAGQERFRMSMVQHYYRNVHAVVFVYDVTKMSSFESLPHWIEECNHYQMTSEIPRILVGNKCDCKDKIAVSTNMAQKFADMHNMPLFETSAKDESETDHVEAIFLTLAHKLKNAKPMMQPILQRQLTDENRRSRVITVRSKENSTSSKYTSLENDSESLCAC